MLRFGRAIADWIVPAAIAASAFLNARTVAALVGVELAAPAAAVAAPAATPHVVPSSIRAMEAKSARAILARNPFDHETSLDDARAVAEMRALGGIDGDASRAPACDGVRAVVVAAAADPDASIAAIDIGGARLVRRRNGELGEGARLTWIGADRVFVSRGGVLCQARVGAGAVAGAGAVRGDLDRPNAGTGAGALEASLKGKIVRQSATEFQVDRGAIDLLVEAQAELMKVRIAPEKDGDRVVGVRVTGIKPGSAPAMLGLENGDRLETLGGVEVTSPEKMLEVYARLKSGTLDRFAIHLTRKGAPINIDYVIR